MRVSCCSAFVASLLAGLFCVPVRAQLDFEREPINYSRTEPTDPVARLAAEVSSGARTLEWDEEHGYLKAVLEALDVRPSSQTLVFSKTSLQVGRISPDTPRAVYFNDDVYVGWIPHAEAMELSAADPQLGGTFYTLAQTPNKAQIRRETARCLSCHASTHTRRVPGHMVRSVYPSESGLPVYRLGTYINDDGTQFAERWGGWYVTGMHGNQRHMGNALVHDEDADPPLDRSAGANVDDLSRYFDTRPYLTPHSDIVALMILQHQSSVHNELTGASHSGRMTLRDAELMNRMLDRAPDFESESTISRYEHAAEKVLKALLLCEEAALTDKVAGVSAFSAEFMARGPFDTSGRSLRQLDLERRLFRYPCSFLIYTEGFHELPPGVKSRVLRKLHTVLTAGSGDSEFAHLSDADRRAIHDILTETHPDYPPETEVPAAN